MKGTCFEFQVEKKKGKKREKTGKEPLSWVLLQQLTQEIGIHPIIPSTG